MPTGVYGLPGPLKNYQQFIRSVSGLVTYWPGRIGTNTATAGNFSLPSQWTFEIWAKWSAVLGNTGILSAWSSNGPMLWLDNISAHIKLHVNATDLDSGVIPTTGVWYHVAGTYDGTSRTVYVNGSLLGGPTSGVTPVAAATPLLVGNYAGSGTTPSAIWEDPAVYNRALSQSEVLAHYQRGYRI